MFAESGRRGRRLRSSGARHYYTEAIVPRVPGIGNAFTANDDSHISSLIHSNYFISTTFPVAHPSPDPHLLTKIRTYQLVTHRGKQSVSIKVIESKYYSKDTAYNVYCQNKRTLFMEVELRIINESTQ